MRIHKAETVVRYQVTFVPEEASVLAAHEKWKHRVHIRPVGNGAPGFGDAMLTKAEINEICDVLGINGREFMADYRDIAVPSSVDVSLGIAGHQ